MRTGRKLQNRERVEKCKETLDQLSRFMGDILDGKLSQREAAEVLGLTAQGLSHELDSCFKQYLKHSHVFSDEDISRLRQIKEETGARILCGIMPFVSLRNATFMKNEMTGINVTDEILARYSADMTKEEGEETGIQIAKEIITKTSDFVDGYYFSFPFNRVHMLEKILNA